MSIHINMESYCDGCPEMDPEVETTDWYTAGKLFERRNEITCKHRYVCENIYQHILRIMKQEEKER